jgi:CO dehydrogenase maturation factor
MQKICNNRDKRNMRVAFVGKGGSGKTTVTAVFCLFLKKSFPVYAIDGDINMHLAELLGFENTKANVKHLADTENAAWIKKYLKGGNQRIESLESMRKTTPPGQGSRIITLTKNDPFLQHCAEQNGQMFFSSVGTYEEKDIGASCYHNHLGVVENVLSHTQDADGWVVMDMVAGIDAFANSLHAQFDVLFLIVEPTRRSVEVYEQYKDLLQKAKSPTTLFVIGNKVTTQEDKEYLMQNIQREHLLAVLPLSNMVRNNDRTGGALVLDESDDAVMDALRLMQITAQKHEVPPQEKLRVLWKLHEKYVSQKFITDRFGDLTKQIDSTFTFS